jgi:hypothetical protein
MNLQKEYEILRMGQNGHMSGWLYILIAAQDAEILKPGKTSFRVKGHIDLLEVAQLALLPGGQGDFILPLNQKMLKVIKKTVSQKISINFELDHSEIELNSELMEALSYSERALTFFNSLNKGHQRYFSAWINDAKTIQTMSKRISQAFYGLENHMGYPETVRYFKTKKGSEKI